MMHPFASRLTGVARLLLVISMPLFPAHRSSAQGTGSPFQTGDVFAGVGGGEIHRFSPSGTLLDVLNTGAGATEDTGMAFDTGGNLYATVFQANNMYKFNHNGVLLGAFGGGYNMHPESIVFDRAGNAYVGQADGSAEVLKFSNTGASLGSYSPQREDRGTDWVDLAADQCTLHYTSEGSSIKRFNVCTNTQLSDFATGLSAPCYAHRIRPNFEELVACTSQVYRLNSSGAVVNTYHLPGTTLLFALNLDPDNKTFWTADYSSGVVFRIDIASGNVVSQFNAGPVSPSLAGLTVYGEITAATSVPPSTTSYYVTTTRSQTLVRMGHDAAVAQLSSASNQDTVIALLFGAPTLYQGPNDLTPQFGATLFSKKSPISVSQVAALVEDFASGYYNALGSNNLAHVRIVVAVSNDRSRAKFGGNQVNFNHGEAWAEMINAITSWVADQGYSGQVDVAGGADMELGFNSPNATTTWVDGYAAATPERFLYDVGDAAGCPPAGSCGTKNQPSWTQEEVWYISWGASPSEPLPETYNPGNPREWARLSLYGYQQHGDSMIMAGALTEFQACYPNPQNLVSTDPTCNPLFTPQYGWQQLYNDLNANPETAQTLSWSTDIKWSSH